MDPISLGTTAAIGMGASALGGGVGAIGNIISGNANAKSYQYQAGIAKINEQVAKQDADYSRAVGETEAQKSGMATRFTLGKIKAAQSGSGLDINSGSAKAVQESEQEIGSHDEAVIRSTAAKRAYGYEVEASQASAQSQLYTSAAKNAKTAGYIGAASSILGSASSVSDKWLTAKTKGIY